MSVHSFWLLILRVIGILLFFSGLDILFSYFNTAFLMFETTDIIFSTLFFLSLAFYGFILYSFVLNPEVLIRLLKLTRNSENETLKIEKSFDFMLRLAIIAVGIFLIVNNLPELIKYLITFFQFDNEIGSNPVTSELVFYLIKLIIGYIFLTSSHIIAKFLKKRLEENTEILDETNRHNNL